MSPNTTKNLRLIQENISSSDFPGGVGESGFLGRATPQDITTQQGRQATGFEPFVATSDANGALVEEANRILFG